MILLPPFLQFFLDWLIGPNLIMEMPAQSYSFLLFCVGSISMFFKKAHLDSVSQF